MEGLKIFIVAKGQAGQRVDVWLARQLAGLSRSRSQQLIREGLVTVNGCSTKESHKTQAGERIEITIPAPRPVAIKAENIPLDILFEDDSLLVINKPAGLVVHPAPGHAAGTLVNAVLHHCPALSGIGGEQRPGIVHRLDQDTSGVMLVAKTEKALVSLASQFKHREISKEYLAIVFGCIKPDKGMIETLIGRHLADRKKMAVSSKKGRQAITRYETLETLGEFSLVRLKPETGRTHQVRVHLAHWQHPVVGDKLYGRRSARELPAGVERQMLHAHKIGFRHPIAGQRMEFSAPLPEDMGKLLDFLRHIGT